MEGTPKQLTQLRDSTPDGVAALQQFLAKCQFGDIMETSRHHEEVQKSRTTPRNTTAKLYRGGGGAPEQLNRLKTVH